MQATLVVVGGDAKTKEIRLKLPTIVGRGKGSTLQLPHALVSRQHCEIYETNGKLMVRDLGSLNGTFINNQRITEAELPAGELLSIGTVTFRAVYEQDLNQVPPEVDPNKTIPVTKTGETIHTNVSAAAVAPAVSAKPAKPARPAAKDEPIDFSELIGEEEELADFEMNDETKHAQANSRAPSDAIEQLLPTAKSSDPAELNLPPAAASAQPTAPVAPRAKPAEPAKPVPEKSAIGPTPNADKPASPKPSSSDDDLSSFLKSLGK